MTLISNIKVFQYTDSGKLCKLCWGIKPHQGLYPETRCSEEQIFKTSSLCRTGEGWGSPPAQLHQAAGLCNLINHKMNQGIGPGYSTRIGPVGTHSAMKGLLDLVYILSTHGHTFKEKISIKAHVLIQTWVLFPCREKFREVPHKWDEKILFSQGSILTPSIFS